LNQSVQCLPHLADSEGHEGQSLGEVGNQVTGREASERHTVDQGTGGTTVTSNDTDPEGHLLKAEGLQDGEGGGLRSRHE
jgi:hypothetical protein